MDVLCQHNARLLNAFRFSLFFMEYHVILGKVFLNFASFLRFKPTSQPTKLRPHESTHFHESTKIGPHENKWFHSITPELQIIFESNAYLPPNFWLNADFQNLKLYCHPLYFFAMRKREGITVWKRIYVVLCRLKHRFAIDCVIILQKLFL